MSDQRIIIPAEVVVPETRRADIGGIPIDYQANPKVAFSVNPSTLKNPPELLALLGALLNTQNAMMRELVNLCEKFQTLEPTVDLSADPSLAPTHLQDTGTDNEAHETADAGSTLWSRLDAAARRHCVHSCTSPTSKRKVRPSRPSSW